MKRNIGAQLGLYPTPVTVIGAMNGQSPTWTLVAHVGIIGHDRILVSMASDHFINRFIDEKKKLSVNLVDEAILPQADYAGSVSGKTEDKSELFDYETGKNGTPIISKAPLAMECTVADVYLTKGFQTFICTIDNTYVEEAYLNEEDKIDYEKLKPILFEFPTYKYLKTGEVMGNCLSFKRK